MDISGGLNSTMIDRMRMCGFGDTNSTDYKIFIFNVILIIFGTKICHLLFRGLGQPRIVSEFIVGLIVANIFNLKGQILQVLRQLEFVAASTYMFVLGLEMDPVSLLRSLSLSDSIAFAGILSTSAISTLTFFLFRHVTSGFGTAPSPDPRILALLTVASSASSSPVVTRIVTKFNLGESDVGHRAVRASLTTDMLCSLATCILLALRGPEGNTGGLDLMRMLSYVLIEILIAVFILRPAFRWVNRRNPEGQPMNKLQIVVVIALTQVLCHASSFFNYDQKANAFLIGLLLPSDGRVSSFIISKFNYIQMTFILPLYFSMANLRFRGRKWDEVADLHGVRRYGKGTAWVNLVYVVLVSAVGKMSGTLAAAKYFGLHWLEAVTLGVLLNTKGYFHFFLAFHCQKNYFMEETSAQVMMVAGMMTIVCAPPIISLIIRNVRSKGAAIPRLTMGMQWYNPATALRMIVGLRGPQNVPSAANIVEMLRGGATTGLFVNASDMIETSAASLVYRHGTGSVTIEEKVVRLREEIGEALDTHMRTECDGEVNAGVTLTRTIAMSSLSDMHEDICCGAQENLAVIIVIPFHKNQRVDGSMDPGDPGFRKVNQNVLNRAPCSVGILVDRGLGRTNSTSLSTATLNVAVLFTGGSDDREALALAGCIAKHRSVRLMVIRFLPDKEAIAMAVRLGRRILNAVTDEEKVMKVDDDSFARFYESHIQNKGVRYMEKHVINGAEAVATLKGLEGGYQLFIVGKGKEGDSALTAGMSDRAECPELGPIGDVLASSDFSVTASVLVIQQHDDSDLRSKEVIEFR